jgi:hypothetical protein
MSELPKFMISIRKSDIALLKSVLQVLKGIALGAFRFLADNSDTLLLTSSNFETLNTPVFLVDHGH